MNNMKCPFCGQELVYLADDFYCPNCYSNKHKHYAASPDVWQALIDTKKKLDIAVDALKEINDRYESEEQRGREEDDSPDWWDFSMDTGEILAKALEQITALEQKDVK